MASLEVDLERGDHEVKGVAGSADGNITLQQLVNAHPILVVSKTWCPFCTQALAILKDYNAAVHTVQVDQVKGGSALQAAVKKDYQHSTVPAVFINGTLIGGSDALLALHQSGALHGLLASATAANGKLLSPDVSVTEPELVSAVDCEQPPVLRSFFWFPDAVDVTTGRVVACMTCVLCLLAIILRDTRGMHWAMLGLFVDFFIRTIAGPGPSPLTQLARLVTCRFEPKLAVGLPQQAAVVLGAIFSGIIALLFLLETRGTSIAGAVVSGMLLVASGLYGFADFCAACWVFGLGVRLGLIPKTVHTSALYTKNEMAAMWRWANIRVATPSPSHIRHKYQGHASYTLIDLHYKIKTDEWTLQHFNPIKYCQISHMGAALGLTGLAGVWKVASGPGSDLGISELVWKVLATFAAVVFLIQLGLYGMKSVVCFKKVRKEWQDPVKGNNFVVPFLELMMFAYLMNGQFDHSAAFAKVVFWIGAVGSLVISFITVGNWIAKLREIEHVNAAYIMPTVGLFVMPIVAPKLSADYTEAAYFWFSFALLMWLALFTITLQKAIVHYPADERHRPLLWVWVAAPAVGAGAWLSLTQLPDANGVLQFDPFAKVLMYMALGLFFALGWGFVTGFFGRSRFDMVDWLYSFPLDTLAFMLVQYSYSVRGTWTHGMAYISLAIASGAVAVTFLQTLVAISMGQVFRPDDKWGPMSGLNKLSHRAFRDGSMPRVARLVAGLHPSSRQSIHAFAREWQLLVEMVEEHGRQATNVLFPLFNEYFPGSATVSIEQINHQKEGFNAIDAATDRLKTTEDRTEAERLIAELQHRVPEMFAEMLHHFEEEEAHLQPIGKKHLSIEMHKQLVRKIWAATPEPAWAVMMPYLVSNLPYHPQRVRLVRSMLWAIPERAQQIGRMIALGVDATLWQRLIDFCPELIPRGYPGWTRYH
ncbi:hypothetical protein WJX72_007166 [[Myrmecia] bisecta]|uniref:Uncharacterized protein n=1 Tax=[Myrmecia] bisecta TaxID=41462 RepID=A0AAW1PGX5_9CHLO